MKINAYIVLFLLGGMTNSYANLNDTIPNCKDSLIYDLSGFKISSYRKGSTIIKKEDLGFFNWGTSSGNFSIIHNKYYQDSLTFVAFDTLNYLVYSNPLPTNTWFLNNRTDVKLDSDFKAVCSFQDFIYITHNNSLYKYSLGSELIKIRDDLSYAISQKVIDENLFFIYTQKKDRWISDALQIVDTTGTILYRFDFIPDLNYYNVKSLFMHNDSLFFIAGSLNPKYPSSLVHIKLDCSDYTANTELMYQSRDLYNGFTHVTSCTPGKIFELCEPNVYIPSDSTTNLITLNKRKVSIYPNPTSDFLNIDFYMQEDMYYQIFNIDSKLIKNGILVTGNKVIDISYLECGFYILKISCGINCEKMERFIKI